MIYLSEAMDRSPLEQSEAYYQSIATTHRNLVDTLVNLTKADPAKLKILAGWFNFLEVVPVCCLQVRAFQDFICRI